MSQLQTQSLLLQTLWKCNSDSHSISLRVITGCISFNNCVQIAHTVTMMMTKYPYQLVWLMCTCLSMPGGQQWKNPHQNQYSFDLDLVHFIFRINWRLSGMHDWFTADWTYTYDHVTWFVTTSKSSDPLTSIHTSFNFHFTSHIQLQSTDIYCRLVWLPDGCSIDKRHQWSANS